MGRVRVRVKSFASFAAVCLAPLALAVGGDGGPSGQPVQAAVSGVSATAQEDTDQALAEYRFHLLDLAFDAATAIPMDPHVKDRCRAQEAVAQACIKLDQPTRAARYAEAIADWRRGSVFADLAFYYAKQAAPAGGPATAPEEVHHFLKAAEDVVRVTEDWRRDRVRVKMARVYAWLRDDDFVQQYGGGAAAFEWSNVARVNATLSEGDEFDAQLNVVDEWFASQNFDAIKSGLWTCVELSRRFYGDTGKRSVSAQKIRSNWNRVPIFVRIEILDALVRSAIDHGDQQEARHLIDEAQTFFDQSHWDPESRVPRMALIAELRFLAGEKDAAQSAVEEALAYYTAQRQRIIDIYRAGVLRSIAEVYSTMGDPCKAMQVYKKAVEEGTENPNSRPRAEDLSATCVSMALAGVEPDAQLWERLRRIRKELREPW